MKRIPWILIFAILLQACTTSPQAVSPANLTPVVGAATNTPIPTDTSTPTVTATFTATSTATITATPTNTLTPTPDQADILVQKMEEGLVFKDAGTFSKKYGSTEWSISVKIEQENIGEMKDGTFVPYITAINYPPKALQIIMEQLTANLMWARASTKGDNSYSEFFKFADTDQRLVTSINPEMRSLASSLMGSPLPVSLIDNDDTIIQGDISSYDLHILTEKNFLEKKNELEQSGSSDFIGTYTSEQKGKIISGVIIGIKGETLVVYYYYIGSDSRESILEKNSQYTPTEEWRNSAIDMVLRLPNMIPSFTYNDCYFERFTWMYFQVGNMIQMLSQKELDAIILK